MTEYIGIHGLSTTIDDQVGRIVQTSNPLDIAMSNKGYFQVEMKLSMKITENVNNDKNWYIGFNNAACIFDQIQIKNNGRTIYSNTFSQITSRLWGMSTSKEYLDYMYQCFLN